MYRNAITLMLYTIVVEYITNFMGGQFLVFHLCYIILLVNCKKQQTNFFKFQSRSCSDFSKKDQQPDSFPFINKGFPLYPQQMHKTLPKWSQRQQIYSLLSSIFSQKCFFLLKYKKYIISAGKYCLTTL